MRAPNEGALGSTLAHLSPEGIDRQFFRWFLDSRYSHLNEATRGTGIPHVDPTVFNSLEIPLPPFAEQRRIVAALECVLAEVGKARERLERVPGTLKRFRQSVLADACSGRLTADWRKDASWEDTTLDKLLTEKPRNGTSPKAVAWPTPVKSLTLTATTSGVFKPDQFKYLDIDVPPESYLWLQPGDILVQRSNTAEYVGVAALYEGPPSGFIFPGPDDEVACEGGRRYPIPLVRAVGGNDP